MRSKLFVPATRPELFAKAIASAADAICLDLEDAVAESRKAEARNSLRELLRNTSMSGSGKTIIVRINGMDTPHFDEDVMSAVHRGVHLINLPKPQSPAHV